MAFTFVFAVCAAVFRAVGCHEVVGLLWHTKFWGHRWCHLIRRLPPVGFEGLRFTRRLFDDAGWVGRVGVKFSTGLNELCCRAVLALCRSTVGITTSIHGMVGRCGGG